MGRIIVLAYDGLEATLVEKFKLEHILQSNHGLISLEGFPEPLSTPILWRSFITGQMPENWGSPHLFRIARKPIAISVPGYNEWTNFVPLRAGLSKAILEKEDPKPYLDGCYEVYRKKKEITYNLIEKGGWDLLMVHVFAPDIIGHWICYDESQMATLYGDLNEWTGQVLNLLTNRDLVLICSDHGMFWNPERYGGWGEHGDKGFWSCNHKLDREMPHLTDFYGILKHRLQVNGRMEDLKFADKPTRRLGDT